MKFATAYSNWKVFDNKNALVTSNMVKSKLNNVSKLSTHKQKEMLTRFSQSKSELNTNSLCYAIYLVLKYKSRPDEEFIGEKIAHFDVLNACRAGVSLISLLKMNKIS